MQPYNKPLNPSRKNEGVTMKQMDETPHAGGGVANTVGTIATLGFYLLSKFSLSDMAACVAILTGLTTIGLNVQKFFQSKTKKNKRV
jgi:hypothetical protein